MNTDLHGFLSEEQKARYRRHLVLPEIGEKGQLLLRKSKVMVVGLGTSADRIQRRCPEVSLTAVWRNSENESLSGVRALSFPRRRESMP
mgnify:CR=1 FL=1